MDWVRGLRAYRAFDFDQDGEILRKTDNFRHIHDRKRRAFQSEQGRFGFCIADSKIALKFGFCWIFFSIWGKGQRR